MSFFVNRIRYKGGSPTLGASSGIINNAVVDGYYFYDDNYTPNHDYSLDYFTIESLEDGNTITFTKGNSGPSLTFYYSIDNGTTWTSKSSTTSWSLNTGDKILFKGSNSRYSTQFYPQYSWCFSSTKKYDVYGNIMSLLYSDNFADKTTLSSTFTFSNMFYNSNKLVNIKNLIMPATSLQQECYSHMFEYCSSLVSVPVLPATTLAHGCYGFMLSKCTSLETVPELPATTMVTSCYYGMFSGNTLMKESPILPAATLAQSCYEQMFNGCSMLNKITCLATNITGYNCLVNWVQGVSATGTFYKAPSMTGWSRGNNGIPSNWAVQDYVA